MFLWFFAKSNVFVEEKFSTTTNSDSLVVDQHSLVLNWTTINTSDSHLWNLEQPRGPSKQVWVELQRRGRTTHVHAVKQIHADQRRPEAEVRERHAVPEEEPVGKNMLREKNVLSRNRNLLTPVSSRRSRSRRDRYVREVQYVGGCATWTEWKMCV